VIDPSTTNALTGVFGITPTTLDRGLALLADALPERLPEEGTGPLQIHRYWADIRGSRFGGDELFQVVRKEFPRLTDPNLMQAGVEPGSAATMEEGQTVTLAIPMRGNIQVRVEEVSAREATAVTLQGHPLSGAVRFMVVDQPGLLRFEVRTYTRASTLVDRIAMSAMGESLKGSAWETLVENVVERSGGELVGEIHSEVRALDEAEAESVEAWIKTVVHRRERAES